MRQKAEYYGLTTHQFRKLKNQLSLWSGRVRPIANKAGYTEYKSYDDWLGFSFSNSKAGFAIALSDEQSRTFNMHTYKGSDTEYMFKDLSIEEIDNKLDYFLSLAINSLQ